jgi:hypothetical protein
MSALYAEMVVQCIDQNSDGSELLTKTLIIKFKNQEIFDIYDDVGFDGLFNQINIALDKKYNGNFLIDDAPEVMNFLDATGEFNIEVNE